MFDKLVVRVKKDNVSAEITETDDGCTVKIEEEGRTINFDICKDELDLACNILEQKWFAAVWALQIMAKSKWSM